MTNLERIQANNAELREAIEMAESLPNAGSGGGGSIETCTLTVESGILQEDVSMNGYDPLIIYTDGSSNIVTDVLPLATELRVGTANYTVAKNTIVYFAYGIGVLEGDCTILDFYIMHINGDSSMYC